MKIDFNDWNSLANFLNKKSGLSDHINLMKAVALTSLKNMEIISIVIEPTVKFGISQKDELIKKLQSYLESDSDSLDNLVFNVFAEAGLHNNHTQKKYFDLIQELNYNAIPFKVEVK